MASEKPESRLKLLVTNPVEWFKTRKASVWTRKDEYAKNVQDFLEADEADQDVMLTTADWNLAVRQKTAGISYLVAGVLAGACANLLAEHLHNVPTHIITSYVVGLGLLLLGGYSALSELFPWAPKEQAVTRHHREQASLPQASLVYPRRLRLRAEHYAQAKQRVFHLQRNVPRLRWFSAVAILVVLQALYQLPSINK